MLDLIGEGFTELMLWLVVGGATLWRDRNELNPLIDPDIDYARYWVVSWFLNPMPNGALEASVARWHSPARPKGRWY